jgi:Uma2 family endonuclease
MSTAPKRLLTPQEYLAQERKAAFKSEYLRGEVFAMAGASRWHNTINVNLARHAGNRLENGPCAIYMVDMRVKIEATGLYTYPDIAIVGDEPQFEDAEVDTLLNPRVLIEVLSDSTEDYDRGEKFGHYKKIPTLQEYILVSQDRPRIEHSVRQADDSWLRTEFAGLEQTFAFASVPARIPLAEIYRGVEFPEEPSR